MDDKPDTPGEERPKGYNKVPTGSPKDLKRASHQLKIWRAVAVVFIILAVALLVAVIVISVRSSDRHDSSFSSSQKDHGCLNDKMTATATKADDVFSGLNEMETQSIIDFLLKSNLSLVPATDANLNSNYIYSIEDYLPSKRDTLDWLDGKSSKKPERRARVILFMGATTPKTVKDVLVGPIPNPHTMESARIIRSTGKELTWKSRPVDSKETVPAYLFLEKELQPMVNILNRSTGHWVGNNCTNCLHFNIAPRSLPGNADRHLITWFFLSPEFIEDYYMYPVSLYVILYTPGNRDQFAIKRIYFNNKNYASVSDLVTDYNNVQSIVNILPNIERHRYGSPKFEQKGQKMDQNKRPPQYFLPDGQRFTLNGRHVDYQKWSFDFHFRTLSAVQLFNVKFGGERIAYEISLQDILVLYSGVDPDDYFKNYFDNGWAIGQMNTPLMRGVDCPHNAVYLDSEVYALGSDSNKKVTDAVCIFEHQNSVPIRHHYSADFFRGNFRYAFSMVDSVLIMRQIMTVWNYDYILDYEFHQNGMIEAKISSTGYVAVTRNVQDTKLGLVLNPGWKAVGNLHQHIFNFKFDMDIAGEQNRFKTVGIGYESVNSRYTPDDPWFQMKMDETLIESEDLAKIKYHFDNPKYYVFFNPRKTVRGQARGYRLFSNGFSKVVLPDNHPLVSRGGSWTQNQIVVTKQQENERTTASHFVQGDPYDPAVDFSSFSANNENLIDSDLVAWVTVGLHHVPTFEDLPVTTTPGKTLTVGFAPFNYFERDPSIYSKDAVLFWDPRYGHKDEYIDANMTCLPIDKLPYVRG